MAQVTLQLLEGLERGLMFRGLPTPVTIGREDDNSVRLNDERVSRFHAKIQEDGGQIILTDLESTNGTRVNGHPIQMRVLQLGDQIAIGRCLLLFGSPEEIAAKMEALEKNSTATSDVPSPSSVVDDHLEEATAFSGATKSGSARPHADDELPDDLFPQGVPEAPRGLRPLQRAQISDFLGYCHDQIRQALQAAIEDPGNNPSMRIVWQDWQRLLRLEMDLAVYMKKVADPDA